MRMRSTGFVSQATVYGSGYVSVYNVIRTVGINMSNALLSCKINCFKLQFLLVSKSMLCCSIHVLYEAAKVKIVLYGLGNWSTIYKASRCVACAIQLLVCGCLQSI